MTRKQTLVRILELIENAQNARASALSPERIDNEGYPFVTGYAYATLREIQEMVEELI